MHWLTKYTNKKCHAHGDMHFITWPHYSASLLCPLSLPRKKAQAVSHSYAQSKPKKTIPENFMTIGGCFELYTSRVTALGWLKKKRRR